jgi:hypothetical protein
MAAGSGANCHNLRVLKCHLQCDVLELLIVNSRPHMVKVKHEGVPRVAARHVEQVCVLLVCVEAPVAARDSQLRTCAQAQHARQRLRGGQAPAGPQHNCRMDKVSTFRHSGEPRVCDSSQHVSVHVCNNIRACIATCAPMYTPPAVEHRASTARSSPAILCMCLHTC